MILSFKPQFVEPILSGTKIHTIRRDESKRWKKGRTAQMATGVRTKNYKQFNEETCTGIQSIRVYRNPETGTGKIEVDGKLLSRPKAKDLSLNDGFSLLEDFYEWFVPMDKFLNGDMEPYKGRLIHWTDKRY